MPTMIHGKGTAVYRYDSVFSERRRNPCKCHK